MRNIWITGAGPRSFIGRNLKEALQQDYNIFAPTHAELELLDTDAVARYAERNQIEIVIHAAVRNYYDKDAGDIYTDDMTMFLNIERLRHSVDKILYFGSGAEYDKRADIVMAKEEDIGRRVPQDPYGLGKYTANAIARGTDNVYNLRLFSVFGRYEQWQIRFLSNLCCKALFDLPLTVRRDCAFDFLSVDDVTYIVRWFLENKPAHQDYNVCRGKPYLLTDMAEMVRQVSGKDLAVTLLDDTRNRDYTGDNSRLLAEMDGWTPTAMRTELERLYEYYSQHRAEIDYAVLAASR